MNRFSKENELTKASMSDRLTFSQVSREHRPINARADPAAGVVGGPAGGVRPTED